MGWAESLSPFKDGFSNLLNYSWVLWIFVPIAALIFGAFLWRMIQNKNRQWTHTLVMRRVLDNNFLSKPGKIRMRRFPLIRSGEVFELENPLLGSFLISELDSYTGANEYSIIIDKNNRIYTNKGEKFSPDKDSVDVSAKHSEIDIALGDFKQKYQEVHKTPKRVEWAQIAKFALLGLLIIATMVVMIKGLDKWSENHSADAQRAAAEAQTWISLKESLEIIDGTVNTQSYILDKIKTLEDTNNIQGIIREAKNETT